MVFIIGCNLPIESEKYIEPPRFVEKSFSDSKIELGIDAEHRLKHGIQLMWYSDENNDIDFYSIFRGNGETIAEISFENIGEVGHNDLFSFDTLFLDTTAHLHVKYHYYIKAFDNKGNSSNSSDTITYILHDSPFAISPKNTISDSFPIFQWINNVTDFEYTSEFVIRIEKIEASTFSQVWTSRFYNDWFGFENYTPISFQYFPATSSWNETNNYFHANAPSNTITCFGLNTGMHEGTYRWKIKSISQVNNQSGIDEASGESPWQYFNISF